MKLSSNLNKNQIKGPFISKFSLQEEIRAWFLIIIMFLLLAICTIIVLEPKRSSRKQGFIRNEYSDPLITYNILKNYSNGKWRWLSNEQKGNLSTLGKILFLDKKPPNVSVIKNYTILIWKSGGGFEGLYPKQHIHYSHDPFKHCFVKNCFIKFSPSDLPNADIVIFNLDETKNRRKLPLTNPRQANQIWAFLSTRSPTNIVLSKTSLKRFNNLFNWSMTYRMDSDIPIPYGRTVFSKSQSIQSYDEWNANKKQDVVIAVVISHCRVNNKRWSYIKELQKYIKIDVYGACGKLKCNSDVLNKQSIFANDCREIAKYKFYLAFENSNCDEYITERLWWYGFSKDTIPIVMGSSRSYYDQLLPPNSFLHVEGFARPKDLVNYVTYLNSTPSDIQQYLLWKKYFKVINEHGYFHTNLVRCCRICEALNYNNKKTKVYKDLNKYLKLNRCYPSWNYKS